VERRFTMAKNAKRTETRRNIQTNKGFQSMEEKLVTGSNEVLKANKKSSC
jgi:hypothetical protein